MASLLLTDSSHLNSDGQHFRYIPKFRPSEVTAAKHMFLQIICQHRVMAALIKESATVYQHVINELAGELGNI
uniref:Uncharacterized protein n=1 Tax=Timema shepardi TaxID=629360 RepID=A0A7R9BCL6_TIMSH|nr:unnamed protein product [Timema shepardi]